MPQLKSLPHQDVAKQARRVKSAAIRAKIVWIGKLSWDDRTRLLNLIKTQ
jgi:hypothetical protein